MTHPIFRPGMLACPREDTAGQPRPVLIVEPKEKDAEKRGADLERGLPEEWRILIGERMSAVSTGAYQPCLCYYRANRLARGHEHCPWTGEED